MSAPDVAVHIDVGGVTLRAGVAYFTHGRQRVTTSFAYDPAYLADPRGVDLEPSLPRQAGQQYADGLPGSFQDSAPDRWGRNLIDKERRARQAQGRRRLPALTPVDYLLGVSDLARQGDLRYASIEGGPFLDPENRVPKLDSLPRLLAAADRVSLDSDDVTAVKILLEAGSASLGGACPKASVRGDDDQLVLAKFPHRDDAWNVMAWEMTALDLAEAAGIRVPHRRLVGVDGRAVLLVDRFDRRAGGGRVGFISAMTLLGARDGESRDYADIAGSLPDHGARVAEDLTELFRRVAFGVAVHNTDDHLRNHGFVRSPGGWTLSPVFDINPDPDVGSTRVTGIGGAIGIDEEPEGLMALAEECRVDPTRAAQIITEVISSTTAWRLAAHRNGIAKGEQDLFAEVMDGGVAALSGLVS